MKPFDRLLRVLVFFSPFSWKIVERPSRGTRASRVYGKRRRKRIDLRR